MLRKDVIHMIAYSILAFVYIIPQHLKANDNVVFYYSKFIGDPATGRMDSTIAGRIIFNPLPEYMKTSTITVEYYSQFDTEKGLIFATMEPNLKYYELDRYIQIFPGSVKKGDTVIANYYIKPHVVNQVKFEVAICEKPLSTPKEMGYPPLIVGAIASVPFILDERGNTIKMGNEVRGHDSPPVLGPSPEIMSRGMVFVVSPELLNPDYNSPAAYYFDINRYAFSLTANITPLSIENSKIRIDCDLKPHRDYDYGLVINAKYATGMTISEMPNNLEMPLDSGQIYNYSFNVEITEPGTKQFYLAFHSLNPAYDTLLHTDTGPEAARFPLSGIALGLFFGVGENGNLEFIVDDSPKLYVDSHTKFQWDDYLSADNRYRITKIYDDRPMQEKFCKRYEHLMSLMYKKKYGD